MRVENTDHRCPNGYEWHNGQWPYLENECLNRKWSHKTLPPCKGQQRILGISGHFDYLFPERKCGLEIPAPWKGMDIDWPYKKRELGDEIVYHCPNNKLTWVEQLEEQVVRCIWHRQTDTMMWWPQDIHDCNSESQHFSLHSTQIR